MGSAQIAMLKTKHCAQTLLQWTGAAHDNHTILFIVPETCDVNFDIDSAPWLV